VWISSFVEVSATTFISGLGLHSGVIQYVSSSLACGFFEGFEVKVVDVFRVRLDFLIMEQFVLRRGLAKDIYHVRDVA
jgi:hypothetical protein